MRHRLCIPNFRHLQTAPSSSNTVPRRFPPLPNSPASCRAARPVARALRGKMTSAVRSPREGPIHEPDPALQASVATPLPTSLRAPDRTRAISVDGLVDEAYRNVHESSSDSDDDENDDLARSAATASTVKRMSRKRSASALSLESLAGEEEEVVKKPRVHGGAAGAAPPGEPRPATEKPVRAYPSPPRQVICAVCSAVPGMCQCVQRPVASKAPVPESRDIVPVKPRRRRSVKSFVPLVNVAPCADTDDSARDRFIFFSYRPQRFHFPKSTYLSALSPFAAVASGMTGVSSKGVCAVCGGSGFLQECGRCPLAFHITCMDPRIPRTNGNGPVWFCNSCQAVKGTDRSRKWNPAGEPQALPSPSTGFRRLIADASEGNPIDFIMHPTLHHFYREERGGDWSGCIRCKEITVADPGVLTESVHEPFECRFAFWSAHAGRQCGRPYQERESPQAVAQIKAYNRKKSRRRSALFFYGFGEENREDFGFPSLKRVEAAPDVIVIDDRYDETRAPQAGKVGSSAHAEIHAPPASSLQRRAGAQASEVGVKHQLVRLDNNTGARMATQHAMPPTMSRGRDGWAKDVSQFRNTPMPLRANGQQRASTGARVGQAMQRNFGASSMQTSKVTDYNLGKQSHRRNQLSMGMSYTGHGPMQAASQRISSGDGGKAPTRVLAPDPTVNAMQLLPQSAGPPSLNPGGASVLRPELLPNRVIRSNQAPSIHAEGFSERDSSAVLSAIDKNHSKKDLQSQGSSQGAGASGPDRRLSAYPDAERENQRFQLSDHANDRIQEQLLDCIASIDFDEETEDCLTDLALANDKELSQLYVGMYKWGKVKFKRQATRLARRRMVKAGASGLSPAAPPAQTKMIYNTGYAGAVVQQMPDSARQRVIQQQQRM